MENLKQQLTDKYNSSVAFFNNRDYEHFFDDARKTIELVLKYMIYEVLDSPELAANVISGEDSIRLDKSNNIWKPTGQPSTEEPKGAFFANILKWCIYYKYHQIFVPAQIQKMVKLKKAIESDLDQLVNYYNAASEISMHTGGSQLDTITQAKGYVNFFPKFIDDIKSICGDTRKLWKTFDKFDLSSIDSQYKSIEEELEKLYLDTGYLGADGGNKFIILLPSECSGINSKLLEAMFTIPCIFVADFGTHSGNDISSLIDQKLWKGKVHIVKSREDFIVGNSMVNWLFCHGEDGVGEQITHTFKDWKVSRSKLLEDRLVGVAQKNNTSHFFILNFLNQPKYAPYIFNMLNNVFGDETHVRNRCDIISFSNNRDFRKDLGAWAEDTIVNHRELNLELTDFLSFINNKSNTNHIGEIVFLQKQKVSFSQDEILYYKEAGIEIFGQLMYENKNDWDFYYGSEITWDELATDADVKRIGYEKFKQNIVSIIRSPKQKTITYTLKHHPGAGGTTMSRRLAYDLCKLSSEVDNFYCLPVFLFTYNEKTWEYLLNLSEKKLDNDFLLIVVEGGRVADENINRLTVRLNSRQRNVIILRVFRTTQQNITGGPLITTLSSKLNEDDSILFLEKYSGVKGNSTKPLFTQTEIEQGLEVVDFPLKLKDDITSSRLNNYVSAFMDDMPDSMRIFCGFVAFASYYADRALNQNLVKDYFSPSYLVEYRHLFFRLLLQEIDEDGTPSGCWRPRYQSFALPILNKVWGTDWRLRISQISKDLLKECEKVGTIGQWDKDLLYGIFILRRGSDFKEALDDDRTKFAKLIQDVMENNQRPDEIYNTLIEVYPDDSIFLGHYGRYLFEQAYATKVGYDDALFCKSEKLINGAIELNPNVDDNYHMLGMLNLRKIQAAKNLINKIKISEDFDCFEFEDMLQRWMQAGKRGFEESIEINPASPYGFTAQCQLYSECLKVAQKLKDAEDFSFCDKELMYVEITDLLGTALNQLGNICQTYDERQTYMIKSIRIYNQIRAFHRQVLGNPQAAVDHYRKLYELGNSQNKSFYGKQFVTSILYARTEGLKSNKNRNSIVWQMGHLSHSDRDEVSKVLQYQRSQGDLDCYENLFWFKMSSNEEFPLDEAINLLIEWLRQYENNGKTGGGKLKALYYLGVCYSAMAIQSNVYSEEYVRNARKYFSLAGELAETFEKSSLSAFLYMGEETDAHCILQPSQIDDAKVFEAVISKIERRKGYVKLPCGLEAFFPAANEYNSLEDEGKTFLRGVIGFRYNGLGLYKFERITDNTIEQLSQVSKKVDEEYQTDANEIETSDTSVQSEVVYSTIHRIRHDNPTIKTKGYMDPKVLAKMTSYGNRDRTKGKRQGSILRTCKGVYIQKDNKVQDDVTKYFCDIRSIDDADLYDGAIVMYELNIEEEERPDGTIKKKYYATNVRFKD